MSLIGDKRVRNERMFRAANQNLKGRLAALEEAGAIPFICECSDADCMQVVEVSLALYEEIHSDNNQYLLLPEHDTPAVERVVERYDGHVVVEKREDG